MDIAKKVFLLLGSIWAAIGGVFVVLGLVLFQLFERTVPDGSMRPLGLIFAGIGSFFFVGGLLFLLLPGFFARRKEALRTSGTPLSAVIVACEPIYTVQINHSHPYRVICRLVDNCGVIHEYRSDSIGMVPLPELVGKSVTVYVDPYKDSRYLVDLEGLLPKVIRH